MTRTDDDTWDVTEGVGATALGVAAGRAAETNSDDPLVRDPYAQMFLDAAGGGFPDLFVPERDLPAELTAIEPRMAERMQAMRDYVASRTLFFDDFFVASARSGVRQAVILAAGLDARAWRLDWPAGTVVYELDQPKVLDFKAATLRSHGVQPATTYVGVAVDLRHDWPTALRDAGFNPDLPTAWAAEGLLPYLTSDAQELLFERIARSSAPGSRVAVEDFTPEFFSAESSARREQQTQRFRAAAAQSGSSATVDTADLFYQEPRTAVVEWLSAHGWQATGTSAPDLMARNGRHVAPDLEDATPQSVFVEGRLP
jgi:methyltransferase (TIGR00027 family)